MSKLNDLLNEQILGANAAEAEPQENTEVIEVAVEKIKEEKVEVVDTDNDSENKKDEVLVEKQEDKLESNPLEDEFSKQIESLKEENRLLQEQSEKWKKFSRQNESSLKELRRETEINQIMKSYGIPDEAKDFIKGDSSEEIKASAEKLSVILASKLQDDSKKTFVSKLQGIESPSVTTSPFGQFFAGWDK